MDIKRCSGLGHYTSGKNRWIQTHFRWLEGLKFDIAVQQIIFQEYVDAVKQAIVRVVELEKEMEKVLENWALAPVVKALMALRGIQLITTMTIMTELGNITRFDSPPQMICFLELIPSENTKEPNCR